MAVFEWNFGILVEYWRNFAHGLLVTVELSVIVIAAAIVGGAVVGAARYSRIKTFNWPATAFIELFRNTPIFVQILWFYYAFPVLIGLQMAGFIAAMIGIGLNMIAYSAEIFRGGIQSIERGQWEAGKAIGMDYFWVMRRIVLPQAVRRMVPAFANRMVEAIKASSLASTIAVAELMFEGSQLANAIYRPLEIYTEIGRASCRERV